MTSIKYHDGSTWRPVVAAGSAGTPGVGSLLAVQRQWGRNNAYKAITSFSAVVVDAAGTMELRLDYTPSVNAWWQVSATIGLLEATTAAYNLASASLDLVPADPDGYSASYQYETAHSGVQRYRFNRLQRTWKLNAGIAYSCRTFINPSFGVGLQYYQSASHLHMEGMAYRR